jgi:hypothetical protein
MQLELGLREGAASDLDRAKLWLGEGSNHEQQAENLRLTARVQASRGDVAGARATLARARTEAEASQSAATILRLDVEDGLQRLRERKPADAVRLLERALPKAERLGDASVRLAAAEALARGALATSDPAGAGRAVAQALRWAAACGTYGGSARLYRLQAAAAKARGDTRSETAAKQRAAAELARMQDGLEPAQAARLARALDEETP